LLSTCRVHARLGTAPRTQRTTNLHFSVIPSHALDSIPPSPASTPQAPADQSRNVGSVERSRPARATFPLSYLKPMTASRLLHGHSPQTFIRSRLDHIGRARLARDQLTRGSLTANLAQGRNVGRSSVRKMPSCVSGESAKSAASDLASNMAMATRRDSQCEVTSAASMRSNRRWT
jgi:hypothetical protein